MFILRKRFNEESGEGSEGSSGETENNDIANELVEAKKRIEALTENSNKLLSEKRHEADKRKKAESEFLAYQVKTRESKDTDFEELFKSSEVERQTLQSDFESLRDSNNREKINNAAMKIASDIADGVRAEDLSNLIARRLKISDGQVKVTDENGELTVSTLEELKITFKSDRYSHYLKGNQSTGGGAAGGNSSGGTANTKTKASFDLLNPAEKSKFMLAGGSIE